MARRFSLVIGLSAVLVGAAACTSPGATTAPTQATTVAPATSAPTTAATVAPTEAATAEASAAAVTVNATAVGSAGTILVDGATGMTLYRFTTDVKDSGESACTGGCLETWPALTVEAGATPTGGTGVTGTLATITRADDGTLQVTYNGLPLYFFKNDQAPGDLNGVYDKWETVAP
jgi:predicted lipoprotein with Yx(FWY)xxD motif